MKGLFGKRKFYLVLKHVCLERHCGIFSTCPGMDKSFDSLAADTLRFPDEILNGKNSGTQEYIKHVGNSQITLIVGKSDEGKPLILSAWIDPPLPGTKDAKKREEWQKYKKSNFWGKVWYQVKKQVFNQ